MDQKVNKTESYFKTWSSQNQAPTFDIKKVHPFEWELIDGKKIVDMSSTSFHTSFGLKNTIIENKIIEQLKLQAVSMPKGDTPLRSKVSDKLIERLGIPGKIFYTTSGAEAIENALKMARQLSGAPLILSRKKSYHGATLGALSITGDWRREDHHLDPHHAFIPEPIEDPECHKLEKIINSLGPSSIAAICLETITGANGVYIPTQKWYSRIQELSKKYHFYIILDEIICGFKRTGTDFGFQHYQITPDFVTMAKAISGGMVPFGALYVSSRLAKTYDEKIFSFGLTQYAHPLGLAALDAVLDLTSSSSFQKNYEKNVTLFTKILADIKKSPQVKEVRQIGLLAAIEYDFDFSWQELIDQGIHVCVGSNGLVIAPALNMTQDKLLEGLQKILHFSYSRSAYAPQDI